MDPPWKRLPSIQEVTSNAYAFLVTAGICALLLLVIILVSAFLWW